MGFRMVSMSVPPEPGFEGPRTIRGLTVNPAAGHAIAATLPGGGIIRLYGPAVATTHRSADGCSGTVQKAARMPLGIRSRFQYDGNAKAQCDPPIRTGTNGRRQGPFWRLCVDE